MSGEIVIPGKPADPTRVELAFFSDGHMEVTRTAPDGQKLTTRYLSTESGAVAGYLLGITANPGGPPSEDGTHLRGLEMRKGAFFTVDIRRIF